MSNLDQANVIAVCWSGGWDSTFRVLDLVIQYGCAVQPIYIIDPKRRSRHHEIAAMDAVREGISNDFPDKADLLLDTMYFGPDDLNIPEINRKRFKYIINERQLSPQYMWMSAVGLMTGHEYVDVMLQGTDRGTEFLRSKAYPAQTSCGAPTHYLHDWEPQDEYNEGRKLFQAFALPLINTPKTEMAAIALEWGFEHLLEHSWFCHYPLGDEPCGMCFTCRHVIYEGLASRFPQSALRRNRFWFVIHPLRVVLTDPARSIKQVWDLARWRRVQLRNAIAARTAK